MFPDVSVIIPVKDENDKYIKSCLDSLRNQNYGGDFEVLVIKGGNRAQARNLGIMMASGSVIAFIDSDCVARDDWLTLLVENLDKYPACGVGGVNVSAEDCTVIRKAIDCVFSSFVGSLGSASLNFPSKNRFVTAVACINSAFKRKDLISAGGFDEEYELCEDTNLSYKVKKTTRSKLLLIPRIVVSHYRRDTLRKFAKQFYEYGLGRTRSVLTDKSYLNWALLALIGGIPFLVATLYFMPIIVLALFLGYLALILVIGIKSAYKQKNVVFIGWVPLLFIMQHACYSFGLIVGLTKGKWKKTPNLSEMFIHIPFKKLSLKGQTAISVVKVL